MSTDISHTLVSPITSKFRLAYEAYRRRRPDISKQLKQKYQERVQRDRDKILLELRQQRHNVDIQNSITSFLKNSFVEVQHDLNIKRKMNEPSVSSSFNLDEELLYEEALIQELISEQEIWITHQYEQFIASDQEEINQDSKNDCNNIICPICKLGYFKRQNSFQIEIVCTNCKITFKTKQSLLEIRECILGSLNEHNKTCPNNAQFTAVSDSSSSLLLCLICDACNIMNVII